MLHAVPVAPRRGRLCACSRARVYASSHRFVGRFIVCFTLFVFRHVNRHAEQLNLTNDAIYNICRQSNNFHSLLPSPLTYTSHICLRVPFVFARSAILFVYVVGSVCMCVCAYAEYVPQK